MKTFLIFRICRKRRADSPVENVVSSETTNSASPCTCHGCFPTLRNVDRKPKMKMCTQNRTRYPIKTEEHKYATRSKDNVKQEDSLESSSQSTDTPKLPAIPQHTTASTQTQEFNEPQPGPSGIARISNNMSQNVRHTIVDSDSDYDSDEIESRIEVPQPSIEVPQPCIEVDVTTTVLSAPDLQLDWVSDSSDSDDEVIFVPNQANVVITTYFMSSQRT